MPALVFTLMACAMIVVAVASETARSLRHDDFHDVEDDTLYYCSEDWE